MTSIRILTYNIHKGFCAGNRRFVLEGIRDRIRETDADLVFLQEIHGETTRKVRSAEAFSYPEQPHFEYLADEAWPHYAYGRNAIYRQGDHGNAILSKHAFSGWENINVSFLKTASRSILHGVIDLPERGTRLHALCVHLGLFERERKIQLAALTYRIASHVPEDEPMIIAGDFNDWRQRAERHFRRHLHVEELFVTLTGRHARTWPVWAPVFPMDRIYFRGVQPLAGECFGKGPWRDLSDHTALMGEFRV